MSLGGEALVSGESLFTQVNRRPSIRGTQGSDSEVEHMSIDDEKAIFNIVVVFDDRHRT